MITNDRQYQDLRAQTVRFRVAIEQAHDQGARTGVDPRVHEAMIDAMESDLREFARQLSRYERLKAGKIKSRKVGSLERLPEALIEARITRNWTHKELASRLGIREQQVQRYESERYRRASLDRILEVVRVLGIKLSIPVSLPAPQTSTPVRKRSARAAGTTSVAPRGPARKTAAKRRPAKKRPAKKRPARKRPAKTSAAKKTAAVDERELA